MNGVKIFQIMLIMCILPKIFVAQNNRTFFPTKGAEILSPKSEPGFFYIRDDARIPADEIFATNPSTFGLTINDEMVPGESNMDKNGNIHTKYQQVYRGIPVEFSMLITHAHPDRNTYLVNGDIIHDLKLSTIPLYSESSALQAALDFLPAKVYLWEDPDMEANLKESKKDPAATNFPKGKLCIFPVKQDEDLRTENYVLGWQFDIYVKEGSPSTRAYVDARSGLVRYSYPLGHECAGGSGNTIYNGNHSINAKQVGSTYYLLDDCEATYIHTYNAINDTSVTQAINFADNNNVWDAAGQRSPIQTHFSAEQTHQYYHNHHGRSGWNGSTGEYDAYHGANGPSYANACWGCWGEVGIFGTGPSGADTDDWNTLDIVGHEFTHGVVQDEINSTYSYEQGALNESFADIFGEMVEQTTEGLNAQTSPWLVGEDRGAIRDFQEPGAFGNPDTYKGSYWVNQATCATPNSYNDNCGVHTNSGVQNHWFYLLAHGGTETNDNGDYFTVDGIGNAAAADIAYHNIISYMTPTSGYLQSRNGSIQSAEDLYGVCSNEAIQTAKAWYGVGADIDHASYNASLNCFNLTSPAAPVSVQGIRSLRLSHTLCGLSTVTSTNFNIYLMAGTYVSIKNDSKYVATGTSSVIIKPNDCSYTVH